MPDEPQNLIPEENPIPASPQEPIPEAPIPPRTSEPAPMPPETPESPTEAKSAILVNIDNEQTSTPEAQNPAPDQTAQIDNLSVNQPVSEATTQPSAQMAGSEPFDSTHDKPLAELESKSQIPTETYKNHTHENLTKAQLTIQEKKRKKLEKIIEALNTKGKITNDEVEKLLHVSDATATRYLSILEKEGKVKQSGRTGHNVSYSRI